MNPIIKALQEELANEGLSGAAKYEDDADQRFAYYAGHEAASARLLTIVQKAVEMATLVSKPYEDGPGMFIARQLEDRMMYAREFLSSLSETADASGEIEKDGK